MCTQTKVHYVYAITRQTSSTRYSERRKDEHKEVAKLKEKILCDFIRIQNM